MSFRNDKISNAGFLAMMMVVGIHITGSRSSGTFLWWWEQLTHYGLFTISVPFFFVCSGFFLATHANESGWYVRICRKRVMSLLVPYLCWSMVALAVPYLMVLLPNLLRGRALLCNIEYVAPVDWLKTAGLDLFDYPSLVPLWYIRALMMFVVVSPLVIIWLRKFGVTALALTYVPLVMLSFCDSAYPRLWRFFGYFFNWSGFFWFSLGCWIALNRNRAEEAMRLMVENRYWLLIVGFMFLFARVLLLGLADCRLSVLGLVYVPLLLCAFWSFVPNTPWPKELIRTTFAVYLLHTILGKIVIIVFPFPIVDVFRWWLMWFIVFVGSFLVAVVMFRTMPRVSSFLFGGRI